MNSNQLPVAIRATAAAIAVFMTFTTLNGLIAIAEPEHSQLMARSAPGHVTQVASAPQEARLLAQGPTDRLVR